MPLRPERPPTSSAGRPRRGGSAGRLEMAHSLISTGLLEVISSRHAGDAKRLGKPPFPDVYTYFCGHEAGSAVGDREWQSNGWGAYSRRAEADVGPGVAVASDVLSCQCRRTRGAGYMRGRPGSVRSLEEFGRVRLSASVFMRDFLHSEIADFHGILNIPDDPDLAIAAGRKLCEQLLEPMQATFGRLAIRSAYRGPAANAVGNRH